MTTISEAEFARLCDGIKEDADAIVKHNPIGPRDEVLLWMLMSCLHSYLSLTDIETPCFNGKPNAGTYREAILYVLRDRRSAEFDANRYLDALLQT